MSKLTSVFGPYADKLQAVVDKSSDKFATRWYPKFFDFGAPQMSLTYTSVLGASRVEAAASIIARNSSSPLRSRAALDKLSGEIPAISAKYKMSESDYRDFMTLQQMNIDDQIKKQQLLDLLFGDVKKAGDGAHKRLDILCMQAVSTGTVTIDINNNPDGLVVGALDLGMPTANKVNAAVDWSTSATATPITDINGVVETAKSNGRSFGKILMSRAKFLQFAKCKEVIDSLVSFNQLQKGAAVATLDKVNDYMSANLLPQIELVDEAVGVEKDGAISVIRPFADANVSFVPDGKLGKIHNALAIEQVTPVSKVAYANYDRALISKWQENDPFAEYTKVELNAFPGVETIGGIYLLSTTKSFA